MKLNPLSALFSTSVRLRNALYDSGRFRARRLQGPVVSIGNISVGGAGKTPFVIALGEMLKQRGVAFDVLSRGYRRRTKGVLQVDPAGSPADFGDEPLLIAQRLGVPVIVGASRFQAGQWAEKKFGPQLHLLDDGFQHRQLYRDFDIVLLTEADVRDRLLPAGRLREPLTSISRADAIVVAPETHFVWAPLTSPGSQHRPHLWRLRRTVHLDSAGPLLAFCAIARPKRFFDDLRASGLQVVGEVAFRDHHAYTAADISYLDRKARQARALGFVTTEKDSINLGLLASRLQPLHIAHLRLELLEADSALTTLLTHLRLSC